MFLIQHRITRKASVVFLPNFLKSARFIKYVLQVPSVSVTTEPTCLTRNGSIPLLRICRTGYLPMTSGRHRMKSIGIHAGASRETLHCIESRWNEGHIRWKRPLNYFAPTDSIAKVAVCSSSMGLLIQSKTNGTHDLNHLAINVGMNRKGWMKYLQLPVWLVR